MVKTTKTVKRKPAFHLFAQNHLERLAAETGAFRVTSAQFGETFPASSGGKWDVILTLQLEGRTKPTTLLVLCRKQLSPRTAIALIDSGAPPPNATRLLFSPRISPRIAEICRERKIGYLDAAGKCLLSLPGVYVERPGVERPRRGKIDADSRPIRRLFSPIASRITRAILSQPEKRWQVQELAMASGASIGLVSRVKLTLLNEGYMAEEDRLLHLRDPRGLLKAWARTYRPNVEPIRLFVPGGCPDESVARWCEGKSLNFALTHFSGAWRTAAMVRDARVIFWLEPLSAAALKELENKCDAQRVDSGENVVLWPTDDPAVFAGSRLLGNPPLPVVSPLQLYLDLQLSVGRGEEAATTIYEQELAPRFAAATTALPDPGTASHE